MQETRKPPGALAYSAQPLKDALAEYDRTTLERERLWDTAESNAAVAAAEEADLVALNKVRAAFYEVTQDRNSRESCQRVDLGFMRQIAARY